MEIAVAGATPWRRLLALAGTELSPICLQLIAMPCVPAPICVIGVGVVAALAFSPN